MTSSRIFVRNLPPQFGEDEFRKHFSKLSAPTDTRLFAARRIGYVGYKTSEDAAKAVKYFNKSFIRMSKIAVEIARPVGYDFSQKREPALTKKQATDDSLTSRRNPHSNGSAKNSTAQSGERISTTTADNSKKRKRSPVPERDEDLKLQEFLKAMQPPKKSKTWKDEILDETSAVDSKQQTAVGDSDADSGDEYQFLNKSKRRSDHHTVEGRDVDNVGAVDDESSSKAENPRETSRDDDNSESEGRGQAPQSDAEWLRNRTSRLLGLLEDDEEEHHIPTRRDDVKPESPEMGSVEENDARTEERGNENVTEHDAVGSGPAVDTDEEAVRRSKRLFLRNLPYHVNEDDIRESFTAFGSLEEVRDFL